MKTQNIATYETDVQTDFSYRTGALFVNGNKPWSNKPYGAEARIPNIIAIHNYANENRLIKLGSVDRHFYEDAELIRNKGGVFDDHCMNGTEGQLRIKELEPQKDIYIRAKDGPLMGVRIYTPDELQKYLDSNMQIIFEKQTYDVNTNPNFKPTIEKLKNQGTNKIIVNGFATDYCVKAAVLGLQDLGMDCYVVTDAIEEVNIDFNGKIDPNFGKKALEEMTNAGAKLVTTKQVLEGRI